MDLVVGKWIYIVRYHVMLNNNEHHCASCPVLSRRHAERPAADMLINHFHVNAFFLLFRLVKVEDVHCAVHLQYICVFFILINLFTCTLVICVRVRGYFISLCNRIVLHDD